MASKKDRVPHWGRWVMERARVCGHGTQGLLASAARCTQQQVSRWAAMASPPKQMRRGLDHSLARALRIDRVTLFKKWREKKPEDLPQIMTLREVPWEWAAGDAEAEADRMGEQDHLRSFRLLTPEMREVMRALQWLLVIGKPEEIVDFVRKTFEPGAASGVADSSRTNTVISAIGKSALLVTRSSDKNDSRKK